MLVDGGPRTAVLCQLSIPLCWNSYCAPHLSESAVAVGLSESVPTHLFSNVFGDLGQCEHLKPP